MCATCGCGNDTAAVITVPHDHADGHDHEHGDGHAHDHGADHVHLPVTETITLEQKILAKNDLLANHNREWLEQRNIVAFNMTSSPGAGKTTLLERTISELGDVPIAVIEGDQETLLDAERIKATGCAVVQINTGAGCHLDADMLRHACDALAPAPGTVLFIENVGNLVCPALFDLGERSKVVIISVTEGTDKPLKYPHMFAAAGLVIVNKTDLLPYVDFDVDEFREYARSINPGVEILPMSVTTGDGMAHWYHWLAKERGAVASASLDHVVGQA
ncbi:hydrogenase nickel incorporation protein HypB [Nocardia sp. NBC_00565]|uniref:hydrogenase nickel incorporation protein HypB n=1 Tax=Nocardia sp. NBC_00565 TaxID=2975993 RepID=UPI002E8111E9|nr:hydrogenase nickel incorporation protein HypB [Nocardia sp. NBC_00565]WUC06459.1 hydrogenase nickel incorporation protein HypB [Nocardia sp. NBC_00565]